MTKVIRFSFATILLVVVLLSSTPVQARVFGHAVTLSRTYAENVTFQRSKNLIEQGCNHLHVILQGSTKEVAPVIECLDVNTPFGVIPNITVQNCGLADITLYWDEFSGPTLCFSGTGSTNLTDYCAPLAEGGCMWSWNDEVTSMDSRSGTGTIFSNVDEESPLADFFPQQYPPPDFAGSPNDNTASSISLY